MRSSVKVIINSYSGIDIETIKTKILYACSVVKVRIMTNVANGGGFSDVLSFEIIDMRHFPSILDNYRNVMKEYQLRMVAYIDGKKIDLDKLT